MRYTLENILVPKLDLFAEREVLQHLEERLVAPVLHEVHGHVPGQTAVTVHLQIQT